MSEEIQSQEAKPEEIRKTDVETAIQKPKPKSPKTIVIGLIAGACAICGVAIHKATTYKTFDAFSLIKEVDFNGVNGSGTAIAFCEDYQACQYNGGNIILTFDKSEGLSNGDTVTLSVEMGDEKEFAKEHGGYVPEELSKTYTVENLCEYIESTDDVPSEVLDTFKDRIETVCNEQIDTINSQDTNIRYSDFTYVGDIVKTPNFETDLWKNEFILVYKVHTVRKPNMWLTSSKEDIVQDCYIAISYSDVSVNGNGDYYVNLPSDSETIGDHALYRFKSTFTASTMNLSGLFGYSSIEQLKEDFSGGDNTYSYDLGE